MVKPKIPPQSSKKPTAKTTKIKHPHITEKIGYTDKVGKDQKVLRPGVPGSSEGPAGGVTSEGDGFVEN